MMVKSTEKVDMCIMRMRSPGFEPGSSAWEADVLARLDYDRTILEADETGNGFELLFSFLSYKVIGGRVGGLAQNRFSLFRSFFWSGIHSF